MPQPLHSVNPVRNSSGALNPAGIILKSNPAAEQRGIISNGVNPLLQTDKDYIDYETITQINHFLKSMSSREHRALLKNA
jgi:hypothetical protein